MKKPNFIIAGFPKCGTTSLHHYLNEHPEIFMPEQKELHFFTYKILSKLKNGPKDELVKETQINSSEKYLSYYQNVKKEIAIGDASPSYINYPSEFLKIKRYLNDPKVIIILRDPINRAYSNYLHLKREHSSLLTFLVVYEMKLTGYLELDIKQVPINNNFRYSISWIFDVIS